MHNNLGIELSKVKECYLAQPLVASGFINAICQRAKATVVHIRSTMAGQVVQVTSNTQSDSMALSPLSHLSRNDLLIAKRPISRCTALLTSSCAASANETAALLGQTEYTAALKPSRAVARSSPKAHVACLLALSKRLMATVGQASAVVVIVARQIAASIAGPVLDGPLRPQTTLKTLSKIQATAGAPAFAVACA